MRSSGKTGRRERFWRCFASHLQYNASTEFFAETLHAMALQEGSYERLLAAGCAEEVAYVQACLRLFFASGPGAVAGETPVPAISAAAVADIARLNKVATFVLKALSRAGKRNTARAARVARHLSQAPGFDELVLYHGCDGYSSGAA
jgi:hypothetical protein